MTEQRALEVINEEKEFVEEFTSAIFDEAFEVAIKCMEKQIAKKVTEHNNHAFHLDCMCPACDTAIYGQPYAPNYCKHCGQKLVFDWGNEE